MCHLQIGGARFFEVLFPEVFVALRLQSAHLNAHAHAPAAAQPITKLQHRHCSIILQPSQCPTAHTFSMSMPSAAALMAASFSGERSSSSRSFTNASDRTHGGYALGES